MNHNEQWDRYWRYSNVTLALGSAVVLVTGMLPDCRDDVITTGDYLALGAVATAVGAFVMGYIKSRSYDRWRESYTGREEDGFLKVEVEKDSLDEFLNE
jgi:hypothetical protein